MKTPEEMAEEFFENWQPEKPKYIRPKARQYALEKVTECFLAGYQAAKDSACIDTNSIDTGTKMQWISVKDRLPPPETAVLWWNKAAQQSGVSSWEYMSYCDDTRIEWGDAGNVSIKNFTHWMPLPKPPEEA